jgi:hypothetical protein
LVLELRGFYVRCQSFNFPIDASKPLQLLALIDSKPQTGNIIPSSQASWLIDAMNELLLLENSHMHSSLGGAVVTTAVMQFFFVQHDLLAGLLEDLNLSGACLI